MLSNKNHTLTFKELSKFDAIGYKIVSPFHLISFLSYVLRNFKANKKLSVLVIGSPGPWGKTLFAREKTPYLNFDITFIEESQIPSNSSISWLWLPFRPVFTLLQKIFNVHFTPICSPSIASVKLSSSTIKAMFSFQPIFIEEGMGSYNQIENFKRVARQLTSKQMVQKGLVVSYKLMDYLNFNFLKKKELLFDIKAKKPTIRKSIRDSYKKLLLSKLHGEVPKLPKQSVVILTAPFIEFCNLELNEFTLIIKRAIKLANSLGLEPHVKAHPAEDREKYKQFGIVPIAYNGAFEEILAHNTDSIKEVWGFNSSSLVYSKAIYDITARRIVFPTTPVSIESFKNDANSLFLKYTSTLELR